MASPQERREKDVVPALLRIAEEGGEVMRQALDLARMVRSGKTALLGPKGRALLAQLQSLAPRTQIRQFERMIAQLRTLVPLAYLDAAKVKRDIATLEEQLARSREEMAQFKAELLPKKTGPEPKWKACFPAWKKEKLKFSKMRLTDIMRRDGVPEDKLRSVATLYRRWVRGSTVEGCNS
jgi:hypothetical protein